MAYNPRDFYFLKAKKENYVARSAFKLEEIDQKFKIIKPGMKILDLGAAPGSWSQYCSKKVGEKGRVLGLDLTPIKLTLPNAFFVEADMREYDVDVALKEFGLTPPFDVVISDMAPKTTGVRTTDQARSVELCDIALQTAERMLKYKGTFVCKLFHSEDFEDFRKRLRARFEKVELLRPKSTRKESKEIFFIAMSFKGAPAVTGPEIK